MATQPAYIAEVAPPGMSEAEIQDKLKGLVDNLQKLADDQVRRKSQIETRWLNNLRAFHGRYDEKTETDLLAATNKSRAFVKITRKKTNSWDARLGALLFPTDEENWDIRPTPVPTLSEKAKEAVQQAEQQVQQANQAAQQGDPMAAQAMAAQAQQALTDAQRMEMAIGEATRRSQAMRQEMKDQLVECDYASECRLVIRDACRLGTGILKGPLAGDRKRGQWLNIDGQYVYDRANDPAPIFKWVDPLSYFPDMSAIRPEDREFEFERHLWSAKDLRMLVRERGFSADAVRSILENRNVGQYLNDSSLNYLPQLRSITGTTDGIKDRFVGWEYHGPLKCEDVAILLRAMGRDDEAAAYEEDNDPLKEIRVICYFCEGKVLKIAPAYPLDSGESLYSIFTFEASEASIFGYGIPEIMADSQKAMNGAWRMALDNAALSTGPQIFIDRDMIEPANREWTLSPRKIWYKKKGMGQSQGQIFEVANVPNNVTEIMNIVTTSRQFIDDETALPVQAEGELTDNPNITATATNFMSLASNITFRRVVKNFDDGITVPSIRRLYDWNMQHNSREDIKGDMKVDARGSGALLQRELQAQMLLNVAQNWSQHPTLGKALKNRGYEAMSEALRASMIQPELLLGSVEEYMAALDAEQQAAQAAQQEDPQQNPSVIAANVRKEAAQIDADSRIQVANLQRQTELLQLAQKYEIEIEKLATMLGIEEMKTRSKEITFLAEVEAEELLAERAERRGQEPRGSGGSISA